MNLVGVSNATSLSLPILYMNENTTDSDTSSWLFPHQLSAVLWLNVVAVIWGSQHAIIKSVLMGGTSSSDDTVSLTTPLSLPTLPDHLLGVIHESTAELPFMDTTAAQLAVTAAAASTTTSTAIVDPAAFTFLRFGLAALLASPYTPNPLLALLRPGGVGDGDGSNHSTAVSHAQPYNATTESDTLNFDTRVDSASTTAAAAAATSARITWRWGLEMGLWMFLGFCWQAIGLQYTTAQRSGFLLYLNVKLVPFLALLLYQREISVATWISALTAFTGTALLAYTASSSSSDGESISSAAAAMTSSIPWSGQVLGDAYSVAAAVASAMFILRLEKASQQVSAQGGGGAGLNAASLWVVTILAGVWTVATTSNDADGSIMQTVSQRLPELQSIVWQHPIELLYLGGVATALANWIQTKAQRDISAERASVIYAMDPVYGALFSYALLGETLNGVTGWVGAGLIALAAATNAFLDPTGSATTEASAINGTDTMNSVMSKD
jgi:drug/metabolite transporter (DMT)-like permease